MTDTNGLIWWFAIGLIKWQSWKAVYLSGCPLWFTPAPLPVCQLDFPTLLVRQPPLGPLKHGWRVGEIVVLVRGQQRGTAEVIAMSKVLVREWRAISRPLSSTSHSLQQKLCMRGAIYWAGGAEIKTRPQIGETTTLQPIKTSIRKVTAEEVVTGRDFKGWAVVRHGGMGQLVHSIALLEGKPELKSPFLHCNNTKQFRENKQSKQYITLGNLFRTCWCFVAKFSLPACSCPGFCLQLMKQPHGMWIQRLDSTNNGVTAGASRVRKKLRVSRDELRTFSAWRTSTKVCGGRGNCFHDSEIVQCSPLHYIIVTSTIL